MTTFATANISLASIYTTLEQINDKGNVGVKTEKKWAQNKMKFDGVKSAAKHTIEEIHGQMDTKKLHCIGLQELTMSGYEGGPGSVPMILEQFGFEKQEEKKKNMK